MKTSNQLRAIAYDDRIIELAKTEAAYIGNLTYLLRQLEKYANTVAQIACLQKLQLLLEQIVALSGLIASNILQSIKSEISDEDHIYLVQQRLEIVQQLYPVYATYQDTYAHYISHAKVYPELYMDLKKDTHDKHSYQLGFDDILIMPVQRLPRYELLVTELIKAMDNNPAMFSESIKAEFEKLKDEMKLRSKLLKGKCLWDPKVEKQLAAEKESQNRLYLGEYAVKAWTWLKDVYKMPQAKEPVLDPDKIEISWPEERKTEPAVKPGVRS